MNYNWKTNMWTHELGGKFLYDSREMVIIEWCATQESEFDEPTDWLVDHIQFSIDGYDSEKFLSPETILSIKTHIVDIEIPKLYKVEYEADRKKWMEIREKVEEKLN